MEHNTPTIREVFTRAVAEEGGLLCFIAKGIVFGVSYTTLIAVTALAAHAFGG